MAENLGAIRYEVEVETASILKAEGVVNKSISNQVKEFDKADKAVRAFTESQKQLGRTVNSMGQVLNSNGKIVANATLQYRKLANEASMGFEQLNTSVNGVARGVRGARPDIQNISYQLQDMAVQAQMGTSSFVIMAQQLPQMLVGMGAVAGAIGFVITALGLMATTLVDTTTSAEKLEKAIEQVKAVMSVGAGGVINYTDEMKELNKFSERLAKIKIAKTIIAQNEVIKNSSKAIIESAESTSSLYESTFKHLRSLTESVAADIGGNMNDVAEAVRGGWNIGTASSYLNRDLDLIASKFKITRNEALELGLALSDVANKGDAVSIKSLQNVTEDLAESYGYSNEQIINLSDGLVKYFVETKNATDGVNELRQALFDKGQGIDSDTESTSKATETASNYALQLLTQKVALEQGERAAFELKMQLDGLTEAQKKHNLELYDSIKATEASNDASRKASDALESEIDGYIKLGEEVTKAEERKAAAAQREKDRLAQRGTTVGLTQTQTIETRFESDLEALKAAREQQLITEQQYADREVELQRQKAEQIKQINQQQLQNQALFTQSQGQLLNSLGGLFGAYAGTMEAQDKESFEKKKKFQTAQALINTAMAISNALAAAPPPINFALAAASGAAGAIQIAAIQNQQFSGGRQYGGPVSQGMYRVNETGVPEIYSHGGKDYLMSTKNANIKPLKEGAAGGMQVIVNNNTPYEVFVTQDQAANIANIQIGREASKAAKGQGTLLKGVMAGTNTTKRARN